MKRLFAIAVMCGAVACGQLDNEDLVFLNGVPKTEEVSVDVSSTSSTANALTADTNVGDTAEYYGDLSTQADTSNNDVANMLVFIDNIGKGYPPTKRTAHSRVWGPVKNVDGQHYTFRYEIRRSGDTFTYCLFMGLDDEVDGEPTCDDVPAFDDIDPPMVHGLAAVLYGTYTPTLDGAGARQSDGEFTLAFEAVYARHLSMARGTLGIRHSYSSGGAAKDITVTADLPPIDTNPALHYDYSYTHDVDGRVTFGLAGPSNIITTTPALEQLTITACWVDGAAGRADVTVSGGDLQHEATSEECWDANDRRTYFVFTVPDYPIFTSTEGDVTQCPVAGCGG